MNNAVFCRKKWNNLWKGTVLQPRNTVWDFFKKKQTVLLLLFMFFKKWCLWIMSKKGIICLCRRSVSTFLSLFSAVCCPFLWILHGPPPGFVWPSTRLQRDLMTFIIRWGNLIWAAPLSEMSSSIWSHAGENKRVSNYSLGVWVGAGAAHGWREHSASRHWEKERELERETPGMVHVKKSIGSRQLQVMRFELGSLSSLWPRSNGTRYYPWVRSTG